MKQTILILLLLILPVTVFPQGNKAKTAKPVGQTDDVIKEAAAYAKAIADFVENEGDPHFVIADIADYNEEKVTWKRYESAGAYEKDEGIEAYTVAYVWKKDGCVVAVNVTYSSPSGDWAQYVNYAFRPDGSLARVDRELRTFMDDIIVNRIQYFAADSKLLKSETDFRDLETQKPIPARKDFVDIDVEIYKKISEMPFYDLFKEPSPKD